jgi:hypothetical protein
MRHIDRIDLSNDVHETVFDHRGLHAKRDLANRQAAKKFASNDAYKRTEAGRPDDLICMEPLPGF